MVNDNNLLTRYNILVAKYQDLKETYDHKCEQWAKQEEYYERIEKKTRELCESILAKNKDEMVLGSEYSWDSLKIEDLLKKTIKSFTEYNKSRTELMQHLLDKAEERKFQIESLTDQISNFLTNGNVADIPSAKDIVEKATEMAMQKAEEEQAREKVPNAVKEAAAAGKVQLIIEDKDEDLNEVEKENLRALMEKNEQAKLTSKSIPVEESPKKKKEIQKQKDEAILSHVVDLKKFEDRMSEGSLYVLECIGSYGLAKYCDIESKAIEISKGELRKTRVRVLVQTLYKAGILEQKVLMLPLTPKCYVYQLSDIGYRIYKKNFNVEPIENEAVRVTREHDNLQHGYGIIDIEKVLVESNAFKKVTSYNRDKAIKLSNGKEYVPDIIAETDRYKEYFEYERGTHTQSDFNDKCDKMVQVTRYLNFIGPNKETVEKKLVPKIDEWIKVRDPRSLKNVTIRLGTAISFKSGDYNDGSCWLIVYDFRKSDKPIYNSK